MANNRVTTGKGELAPGQQGTLTYAMNRWREDALTAFLDDLVLAEQKGFQPEECRRVHQGLQRAANIYSEYGDRSALLGRTMLGAMERLVKAYEEWNDPSGEDHAAVSERRKRLHVLRRRRQKLAQRMRTNLYILENQLDLQFVEAQYTALGDLVKALPHHFGSLAKSLQRITKKILVPPL